MQRKLTRRTFLRNAAWAGSSLVILSDSRLVRGTSANSKLNIAGIGIGGRGAADIEGVASENLVALCDVDEAHAARTFEQHPGAKRYKDFRRMLDEMHNQIDAVVIGTPDHTHAPAGVMAMKLGKHCYCEKPLTHSVYEARMMANIARENNLVTQMGTQIHAENNYRRVVELVQSNAIGPVREVHVWLGANFDGPPKPADMSQPDAPTGHHDIPQTLDWDLWLGPAAYRFYSPAYAPFHWRYWWNFANGQLGDFFCHYCDLAFWALKLRYPTTIEAEGPVHRESAAKWTIARQEYPGRGDLPPVTLTWYNGGGYPALVKERNVPQWSSGVLFIGSKGMLLADYGKHELLPEAQFAGFVPPAPFIPNSIGHHREWIEACKTGGPTTCNFDYSGALTEAALLCNVALRTGRKLSWDAANLKAVGCPEADAYIQRPYRPGWTL
ncbi:MAG: Gfo/Idh/MocA family oxidoreductase [Sedimentisphaerales bacterium]|jgi:predicted dehydrogenase|nr:Gfo/Idh/MocA family oxidoreductase [Sedimentisphaerales bacterium]HNY80461.1 Gfo/Idh/MocA family oxidoreductase [Sedimentisphaerales bacterium]HOC65302.1 Gfo/Idh/MocA family oxidoreductase [Sedimentisphaerales bacterium]HOH66226.1 Gfo/Idh/MocA family oxidoreductase [Sedimentisphaerales bacterium]HPY49311.1 Gfo/Idh/MocA family oxidoreductase [Sedimentisphaerales bacterium]